MQDGEKRRAKLDWLESDVRRAAEAGKAWRLAFQAQFSISKLQPLLRCQSGQREQRSERGKEMHEHCHSMKTKKQHDVTWVVGISYNFSFPFQNWITILSLTFLMLMVCKSWSLWLYNLLLSQQKKSSIWPKELLLRSWTLAWNSQYAHTEQHFQTLSALTFYSIEL